MALTLATPFALWEKGRDEGILTDAPSHPHPYPSPGGRGDKRGRDEGILIEVPTHA